MPGSSDIRIHARQKDMCSQANAFIILGVLVAAMGGIFFIVALDSIRHETEGFVIIMPQILLMIGGSILIGIGCFFRHRHCH